MPTLSVGSRSRRARSERGVTLIELLVVVSLIALLVGISFPAVSAGLDTLRLNSAANDVVTFFNNGLNHAERRQRAVEVTISRADNAIWLRSTEPGYVRKLEMPQGVTIAAVLPEDPAQQDASVPRVFFLYPGGTVPQFGVRLVNRRQAGRIVRVDPITGVPRIEKHVEEEQS